MDEELTVENVCGLCKKNIARYECECGLSICECCLGYNYQDESFVCKLCWNNHNRSKKLLDLLYDMKKRIPEVIDEYWKR